MMVDKSSPKYPEYVQECEALIAELERKEKELDARQKREGYNKGLEDPEYLALCSETNAKLKEIKKKYGFD